jgi:hypothetical protein
MKQRATRRGVPSEHPGHIPSSVRGPAATP